MTEKRFRKGKSILTDFPTGAIIDKKTGERYYDGIKPNYISSKELVKLLNELHEENEELKQQLQNTSDQRDEFYRGARENANRVGKLEKENEQLRHDATILIQSNQDYRNENEQLKQRNDRQAKQLDRLYHLIEEKDWRTLTDILDDFKRCEEQLQREWRTYK